MPPTPPAISISTMRTTHFQSVSHCSLFHDIRCSIPFRKRPLWASPVIRTDRGSSRIARSSSPCAHGWPSASPTEDGVLPRTPDLKAYG